MNNIESRSAAEEMPEEIDHEDVEIRGEIGDQLGEF